MSATSDILPALQGILIGTEINGVRIKGHRTKSQREKGQPGKRPKPKPNIPKSWFTVSCNFILIVLSLIQNTKSTQDVKIK